MRKYDLSVGAVFLAALTVFASPATEEASKLVAEKGLPNLMKNGGFEKVLKNGQAADWSLSKSGKSKCKITIEKDAGVTGNAAVFTSGNGTLFSWAKVKPGEKIYVKVKSRKFGNGNATLTIRFHDNKKQWLSFIVRKKISFAKDGEWAAAEIVIKAPEKAAWVIPLLVASGLDNPDSKIVFDELEVYNLSQAAEK